MNPSLYIHIPFCRQKCIYCDFYSTIYNEKAASGYIDALMQEVLKLQYDNIPTIYIGGGTPTILANVLLERLLKALDKRIYAASEVTIEANPESLDDAKIKFLLGLGVNRISIGLQSFKDAKLKALGRVHNAKKAEETVLLAAKRGFKNISIDLIFGSWVDNLCGWKKELENIGRLPVTHTSCYSLSYEKGTPLFEAMKQKSVFPLEDEIVAPMYEMAIDLLALRGLKQYEVSSFAREGFECKHNIGYWNNDPYIGLGASAVSYIGGVRSKRISDVAGYIQAAGDSKEVIESSERLTPLKAAKETAAIKIRTKDGIDFEWFRKKTGFDLQELEKKTLPRLLEDNLIKYKKDGNIPTGIALKRKGFLFCDTVSSALL